MNIDAMNSAKPSLQQAIFAVLLSAVLILTLIHGLLGYTENRQAVNEFSRELIQQQQNSITRALSYKFNVQASLDRLASDSISKQYELGGMPLVQTYLLNNLNNFDEIAATFFTTKDNDFGGYIRQGTYLHMVSNKSTDFAIKFYETDSSGALGQQVNQRAGFYASQRPWYASALQDDTRGFSDIFTYHAYATLALPHSLPVYDSTDELLGVVGSNIFLGEFGGFLKEQMQPFNGVAIILDNQGHLIASSLDVSPLFSEENRSKMVTASQSDNPFVSLADANPLTVDLESLASANMQETDIEEISYRVASFPFDSIDNLNWKVTIFVPEQAFHKSLDQLVWQIGIVMLVSLVIATFLAMWWSRALSSPISSLIRKFSAVGNELSTVVIPKEAGFELREVSALKNSMSIYQDKLNNYVTSLQEKIAENKLQIQQIQQLAVVSQSIDDMCLIANSTGQMEWANAPFLDFFGIDPLTIKELTFECSSIQNTVKTDTMIALCSHIRATDSTKVPENYTSQLGDKKHLEFRFFPVDEGNSHRVLVIIRDISKQIEHEKNLAIWRQIFESSKTGIALSLKNDRTFDFVNPAFASMYGGEVKDFIGTSISQFYPDEHKHKINDLLNYVNESGGVATEAEHVKKDGQHFPVFLNTTLVVDQDGQGIGRVSMVTDLTESKKLQQQLFQSQKLHAIGSLAGGVVHDMNNVLSAVLNNAELGFIESSELNSSEGERFKTLFSSITKAAARGAKLTQQVMSFSRMETIDSKPVFLDRVLRESIELIKPTLTSNICIELDSNLLPSQIIMGNESQIQQVFVNLINNAAKAIVKAKRRAGKINVGAITDGAERVTISIKDNGCGIKSEHMAHIFEPFYTNESKGQGTGLGLAIVERIVAGHSGQITFTSEEGQGTTFELLFDHVSNEKEELVQTKVEMSNRQAAPHIVLVDDDTAILSVWKELLELDGFVVSEFNHSSQALDYCLHHQDIDCVFTDFDMPEMNGAELCDAVRQNNPSVKLILATGYSEVLSKEKLEALNIAAILYKPISYQVLLKELRAVGL